MVVMYQNYQCENLEINNVPYKNGQLDIVTKLNISAIIKTMKRTNVRSCDYNKASMIASY